MKRHLVVIASVLFLLAGNVSPAFAQLPNGQPIYLPLVGTDINQQAGELQATDQGGEVQQQSVESVPEKAASTASRGISSSDLKPVSIIVVFDDSVSAEQIAAISGGQITHRYNKVFRGASLVVGEQQIGIVQAIDGVSAVYLDTLQQLETDASPAFIGAPTVWNALGGQLSAGEGVVVGVLDSGVWPEHPSFSDPDPSGKAFAPPAVAPSACDFGNTLANANDAPFTCNNKLIGAYSFIATYKAVIGLLPSEFDSARDDNGHGTHTATTSAGNAGVNANIYGRDLGIVSGIAPRAQVIAYRVCGDEGCFQSDSIAAIEQAIVDGVDVINFSISGGNAPYSDAVELAFLGAYANGIFVAASAGNSGPGPDTVSHRGPWVTTVAASTSNRHFLSTINLTADNGDTLQLVGATVTTGVETPTPVVISSDPACALPAGTFAGTIVVCDRVGARLQISFNAAQASATGMILRNVTAAQGKDILTDNHFLPSVHIGLADGASLQTFVTTHSGVMATFTTGTAQPVQGDRMASFSSRGGVGQTLGVSKPDITAPGVQILAGTTPLPATILSGLTGQLFQSIQGTSMSSPHIAGSAALLKALHPNWTPGQIKSAMMTSAVVNGVTKEDGVTPADAFDYGSGRIDLSMAGNVGFTFDESAADYVALEDALWNANYPSLFVPNMPGRITVSRTLHNEQLIPRNWKLTVAAPSDVSVIVPNVVHIPAGGDASFTITVDASTVPQGAVRYARLTFKQGNETQHFPITIVRGQPEVTLEKSCEPSTIARGATTTCTLTFTNQTFEDAPVTVVDQLPQQLKIVPSSIVGAVQSGNGVSFNGTLAAAQAPIVNATISADASPTGYLPLSLFGTTPIAGVGDESIVNFNVPAFTYAGETYTRIGLVSNGYIVVGGGTSSDVDYINTDFPDAAVPNNVLAPFWTDLNPSAGGALRINVLTDNVNSWIIAEWENVPNYSSAAQTNSFQVWIGIGTVEDISFVYGPNITSGDGGFLTIGAENRFGNSGETVYFDGTGTAPAPSATGYEVDITSTPGAPGQSAVITFAAKGDKKGTWTNCAELTSPLFQGVNIACASGEVTN